MICRKCKQEFTPYVGKPGYIDECPSCACDVPLVGGNMVWAHKTAPEIEIKSLASARAFAKVQRRFSASSPLASIVQGREAFNPGTKAKSGAQGGAGYSSRLNEKRVVKR